MRKLIAVVLVLLGMSIPAQAQTATPTTSPFVHTQGEYLFITDPNITFSGVWTNQVNGFLTYKQTTSTAAYAAFTVSDAICTLSVGAQGNNSSPTNIQINAGTTTVYTGVTPAIGFPMVVDTTAVSGDFTVKIFMSAGNLLQLFSFQLLECPDNTPVPTATVVPTATPIDVDLLLTLVAGGGSTLTPSNTPTPTNTPTNTPTPTPEPWVYLTVTSGQLTRFDYTASAGDVHNANIITLILFSLWAMFFFAVFVYWRRR